MQPLQARFATQDQAESAIRKLASLRSDCFRLERIGSNNIADSFEGDSAQSVDGLTASVLAGSAFQSSAGVMASADVAAHQWGVTPQSGTAAEFMLSAKVPGDASEQARTVILQSGGQII